METTEQRNTIEEIKAAIRAAATPMERIAACNAHNTESDGIALSVIALSELEEESWN